MQRFETEAYKAVIDEHEDSRSCRILSSALHTMQQTSIDGYPAETCGLLIGTLRPDGWHVQEARPIQNLNQLRAQDRFQLDPVAYQAVDRSLRGSGTEIIGVFHSHPDCLARPSPTDLEHAWEEFIYPIISVHDGQCDQVLYWSLNYQGKQFQAITHITEVP